MNAAVAVAMIDMVIVIGTATVIMIAIIAVIAATAAATAANTAAGTAAAITATAIVASGTTARRRPTMIMNTSITAIALGAGAIAGTIIAIDNRGPDHDVPPVVVNPPVVNP